MPAASVVKCFSPRFQMSPRRGMGGHAGAYKKKPHPLWAGVAFGMEVGDGLFFEQGFGGVHAGGDVDAEGAAAEAGATVGALGGLVVEEVVLRLDVVGEAVEFGLVEQLVDAGDGDALGAGRAVVAVGAVAAEGGFFALGDVGVVLLGLGGVEPVEVALQLVEVVDAEDAGGDAGLGQAVGYALLGGVGHAEGRGFLVEQLAAAAEGFHDGDADVVRGAVVVELHAHGVDAALEVVHGSFVPGDGAAAQLVEGGVEAEHDDLDPSALGGAQGHLGVVAAEAYVLDFALFLQLEDVVEEGRVLYLLPFLVAVGDVDHAHLDVVGLQAGEEVLEAGLHLLEVACAGVLAVFVDGADVALDDHLVAAALEGVADVGARLGVGVVDVDVVHAAVQRHGHQLERGGAVQLLESAAADTDFADLEARGTQRAVLHVGGLLRRCLFAAHCREAQGSHQKGVDFLHVYVGVFF